MSLSLPAGIVMSGILGKLSLAFVASFGGGDGTSAQCDVDTKHDSGSAECKRNGYCVSAECCWTEVIIPPHDDLVPGNKRIVGDEKVSGFMIHRMCDPPITFLGLTFGWWTCEIETITPLGAYHQYTLAPCPEPPKEPTKGSSSGVGIQK